MPLILPTPYLKYIGVAAAWLGAAGYVYASSVDPRGLLRRHGSSYVAGLDADFRAMFLRERGSELAWLQVVAVTGCLAIHAMTRHPAAMAIAGVIAFLPRVLVTMLLKRRRARIDDQANAFALALSSTLKTTASVGDALRYTAEVTANPLRQEIDTALREIRVGSTVEEALLAAAGRSGSQAFDIVVSALLIGHKTGGELPSILEQTSASLRELKRLEELTDRVTHDAKRSLFLAGISTALMVILLPRFMPTIYEGLLTTTKGQVFVVQAAAIYLLGLFLGVRFLRKSV